jgi:hypothetical protein
MKKSDIYRIKGTTERVEIVSVRGANITVLRANGTVKAVNKSNLKLPIEEMAMNFFMGSGGGWMTIAAILLLLTSLILSLC